jgi:NAD(P)-dependent dehydrogenase (short-subunit alcohol dehydrogenase family)
MPEPKTYLGRLKGKNAIVTGAGTEGAGVGIGRAIAIVLGCEGARVCVADRDQGRAQATLDRITSHGGEGFHGVGDVTDEQDCARLVGAMVEAYGRLDILVNNVGVSASYRLATIDAKAWSELFDVNLKSAMLMSKYAVPAMKAGGGGSIINISSIAGIRAHGAIAYGPSKAAMAALAREIAVAEGRSGIRANTVAPGHLMTPHVMNAMPEKTRELRRTVAPLGLEGDAWDVALAVLFLASDESRFITGTLLPVDGGVTEVAPLAAHALIEQG